MSFDKHEDVIAALRLLSKDLEVIAALTIGFAEQRDVLTTLHHVDSAIAQHDDPGSEDRVLHGTKLVFHLRSGPPCQCSSQADVKIIQLESDGRFTKVTVWCELCVR